MFNYLKKAFSSFLMLKITYNKTNTKLEGCANFFPHSRLSLVQINKHWVAHRCQQFLIIWVIISGKFFIFDVEPEEEPLMEVWKNNHEYKFIRTRRNNSRPRSSQNLSRLPVQLQQVKWDLLYWLHLGLHKQKGQQ